jgi:elongation factor 3
MPPTTTDAATAAENKESVKILEQMLTNMSIATTADTVNKASLNLASFINGPIEDKDAPTQ